MGSVVRVFPGWVVAVPWGAVHSSCVFAHARELVIGDSGAAYSLFALKSQSISFLLRI